MIRALTRVLAKSAARRFPPESQVRREWLAELDYLAQQGKRLRMLAFAAGLTFVRPSHVPAIGFTWRTLGTLLTVLAGPAVVVMLPLALVRWAGGDFSRIPSTVELALYYSLGVATPVLIGLWRGSRSVIIGPLPVAILLAASVTAWMWLPLLNGIRFFTDDELVAGAPAWMSALPILLLLVGRVAQTRHGLLAVIGGIVAWLVFLDIMIIVDFWPYVGTSGDGTPVPGAVVAEHAPFWYIYVLTGSSFGVLSYYEEFTVGDNYTTYFLTMLGIYAICYCARACRVRPQRSAN